MILAPTLVDWLLITQRLGLNMKTNENNPWQITDIFWPYAAIKDKPQLSEQLAFTAPHLCLHLKPNKSKITPKLSEFIRNELPQRVKYKLKKPKDQPWILKFYDQKSIFKFIAGLYTNKVFDSNSEEGERLLLYKKRIMDKKFYENEIKIYKQLQKQLAHGCSKTERLSISLQQLKLYNLAIITQNSAIKVIKTLKNQNLFIQTLLDFILANRPTQAINKIDEGILAFKNTPLGNRLMAAGTNFKHQYYLSIATTKSTTTNLRGKKFFIATQRNNDDRQQALWKIVKPTFYCLGHPHALCLLAQIYRDKGRHSDAIQYLLQAKKQGPIKAKKHIIAYIKQVIHNDNAKILEILIKNGIDKNMKLDNHPLIYLATKTKRVNIIQLLVKLKADITEAYALAEQNNWSLRMFYLDPSNSKLPKAIDLLRSSDEDQTVQEIEELQPLNEFLSNHSSTKSP